MSRAALKTVIPYKTTTLAYYKGSTVVPLNPKAFALVESGAANIIEKDLRAGTSIAEIKRMYTEQIDELEQKLVEYQAAHPGGVWQETTAEEWLGGAWGPDWATALAVWYMDVAILLKLRVIKNDAMNGWLVLQR